jgi:peroxiredoxin Q/BCP
LAGLLAGGDVVLYFYPADFTPVCTREACEFRDRFDDLSSVGVQIVGVSPQSASSHQRFRASFSLPFPLLCDERKVLIKAFGVDGPLGFGVRRATYLIGTDGIIKKRVVADLFLGDHMELIRGVIADHQ